MSLSIKAAKYQGDANRGYRGDPGLGSFFGGIGRGILTVGRAALGIPAMPSFAPPATVGPGFSPPSGGMMLPPMPTPGARGAIERFLPGGSTGFECAPGMGAPTGYHLNKSGYFLRSEGRWVEPGTRYVRNRKRNPANARATSRAISRVKSAKKYAKSLSSITIREK